MYAACQSEVLIDPLTTILFKSLVFLQILLHCCRQMSDIKSMFAGGATWPEMQWVVTDSLSTEVTERFSAPEPADVAFLQYTSGQSPVDCRAAEWRFFFFCSVVLRSGRSSIPSVSIPTP